MQENKDTVKQCSAFVVVIVVTVLAIALFIKIAAYRGYRPTERHLASKTLSNQPTQ